MADIELSVSGACCRVDRKPIYITERTVGLTVSFAFGNSWTGLTKNACFAGYGEPKVIENISQIVSVPWEVLQERGPMLRIGVEGRNSDNSLVIPTVWAKIDTIMASVDDSVGEGTDPTPTVAAQLEAMITTETATREAADTAEAAARTAAVEAEKARAEEAEAAEAERAKNAEAELTSAVNTLSTIKQDKLTAGTNITISADNVISATGGGSGGGAVDSVNGKTGAVVLDADDVGALPTGYHDSTKQDTLTDADKQAIADLHEDPTIPTVLPNPYKLTLTGAVSAEYDGSEAVSVTIPEGGGSSSSKRLIRTITVPAYADAASDTQTVTWTLDDTNSHVVGCYFDTDDDGNAFDVKAVKFTMECSNGLNVSSTSINLGIKLNATYTQNKNMVLFYRGINSSVKLVICDSEHDTELNKTRFSLRPFNGTSSNLYYTYYANTSNQQNWVNAYADITSIASILFYVEKSANFGFVEGTVIKVWVEDN